MNRRGFFGALLALPAALKAVALAKPVSKTEWWKPDESVPRYLNGDGEWERQLDRIFEGRPPSTVIVSTRDHEESIWEPVQYRGKTWWWHR